jgi:hypothetical protein
VAKEKLD